MAGLFPWARSSSCSARSCSRKTIPWRCNSRPIRRIEGVVEAFRKTGDIQSRMGDLGQAAQELCLSNQMLEARRAWESLALGLIKLGSIRRMQSNWAAAAALYKEAGEAARRAGNVAYQADALAWGALVETSRGNVGQALADATQAVRLAETVNDKDVLARALDVLGTSQVAQRDLAGAAATIEREVAVARESKDPMTVYFAYLNREDVFLKTAERCDFQQAFEPCYQALDLAKADLQQMLSITRRHSRHLHGKPKGSSEASRRERRSSSRRSARTRRCRRLTRCSSLRCRVTCW